jgi:hypothetical protein
MTRCNLVDGTSSDGLFCQFDVRTPFSGVYALLQLIIVVAGIGHDTTTSRWTYFTVVICLSRPAATVKICPRNYCAVAIVPYGIVVTGGSDVIGL